MNCPIGDERGRLLDSRFIHIHSRHFSESLWQRLARRMTTNIEVGGEQSDNLKSTRLRMG